MGRRPAAAAGVLAFLLAVAWPASAARPEDPAQGCANTKAGPLAGYCETNP